jgi:hypothetical protein
MFLRVLKYDFLVFLTLIKYQKYSSCENYKFFGNSIIYIYIFLSSIRSRSRALFHEIIELLLLANDLLLALAR